MPCLVLMLLIRNLDCGFTREGQLITSTGNRLVMSFVQR